MNQLQVETSPHLLCFLRLVLMEPMELVELDSLNAAHIKEKLLTCLQRNGLSTQLLQEELIGFCSDGASVMLGVKSGVGNYSRMTFHLLYCGTALTKGWSLLWIRHLMKQGEQRTFMLSWIHFMLCTARHLRTWESWVNVPTIYTLSPLEELGKCSLFAGWLLRGENPTQPWHSISMRHQRTTAETVRRKPNSVGYYPSCARSVLSKVWHWWWMFWQN